MSKIKILFVITGLYLGGAEMMLYKILSRIDRDKFALEIVSLIDRGIFGDRFEALDIPLHIIGMPRGIPTPNGLGKLVKLVNSLQPDLLQGWMYHGNIAAQIGNLLARRKVPVCWSIHHSIDSLANEKFTLASTIRLTIWLSRYVDRVVFSSQRSKQQHEALGYASNNTQLIHDNFDVSRFQPLPTARKTVRQELNLAEDSLLIGSIARYHPMKDHANFLRAAALIAPNYPQLHFLLVGRDVTPSNPALANLIEHLNLQGRVHLLGERHDIPQIAAALDIFTSSSAFGEAFPNVIGEAMSCEIPCVVTDIGDSGYIVGDTGLTVPPQDSEALATAWEKLLAHSEQRMALAKQARQRILQEFSLDAPNSAVKQYENLYSYLTKK
jgi:glycosyltransferase involved in cell wall biosynthesis